MDKKTTSSSDAFQRFLDRHANRPWYQKVWDRVYWFFYLTHHDVRYYFMKIDYNVEAKNEVCAWIKDDLEFGYDQEMIYNKIMCGSYNNDPISPDKDWFRTNNINWKSYLRRPRVTNRKGRGLVGEYQLCPMCNGNQEIKNPTFGIEGLMLMIPCNICKGDGIILKPIINQIKTTKPNNNEKSVSAV